MFFFLDHSNFIYTLLCDSIRVLYAILYNDFIKKLTFMI